MRMNEFLDRYIQGEPGGYFFYIEVGHEQIQGGMFTYKADARQLLLNKILDLLDGPEPPIVDYYQELEKSQG